MELVGMKIRKNFQGFGVFTGLIESYDAAAGYFKIQYEDGDSEEVDFEEIESILREMGGSCLNSDQYSGKSNRGRRPKKRRRLNANPAECEKDEFDETLVSEKEGFLKEDGCFRVSEEVQENGDCKMPLRRSARSASRAAKCGDAFISQDDELGGGEDLTIKPELPSSSNDLDLDGLHVFDLFSVYCFLRSFSRLLFLSPFRLAAFVASLRCEYANFLIDSIHFSILQALKQHLKSISEEGSQSASDCLRYLNWELLDLVTWPVFLVQYLLIHGWEMKPGFSLNQLKLLDLEYYKQPAGVKLKILQYLCDDVIEVDSVRLELDRRIMGSEINVDAAGININIRKKRKSSSSLIIDQGRCSAEEQPEETDDGNIDDCCLCGMDGSLICCDGCPAAFHSRCVGVTKELLPEGEWYCPECSVKKTDGLIKLSKPSCGAELLGIDPHGRLYFGSCDRLLVSDSCDSDGSHHYYNTNDLDAVITVLKSCYAYSEIVNAISMYWGFPISTSVSYTQYQNNIQYVREAMEAEMHSRPLLPSENNVFSDGYAEKLPMEPKSSEVSDLTQLDSATSHELVGLSCPISCSEPFVETVNVAALVQPSQQAGIDCPTGSVAPSKQVISLEQNDLTVASEKFKPGALKPQSDPDNYINYYSFGRIASSFSVVLMHKSSEGNNIESKVSAEDIKSAQIRAISEIPTEGCFYAYRNMPIDTQKENCGWCVSCKTSSDSDCLFRVVSNKNLEDSKDQDLEGYKDKNFEGPKSQTVGLHNSEKNQRSHITPAIQHILSIESRARSLMSGPWAKPHYSQQWQKAVMKASDVESLKLLLLTLELNLRRVALSAEWSKPVDDAYAIVSSSIVTSPVHASSNYGGSRKRGRKSISVDEINLMSRHAKKSVIYWWRGGKLSRQAFQCKMLPRELAYKGGRQAGCRKVPHMLYPESSDFGKRSKYVSWRVAVEMSQSLAQLIYQAKDLDSHIKWEELSDTHRFAKLAKESKKVSRLMKKVTICRKSKEGKQVKYLLDFGKRETVPPFVIKHGGLLEESNIGRKRYWLGEAHVPLDLLKSYEEKNIRKKLVRLSKKTNACMLKKIDSETHSLKQSECKIKRRKRSEGLSYLITREHKYEKQLCRQCNEDVLVREAVNCQFCEGFFHRKHFRVPKGVITTTFTCSRCRSTKSIDAKDKNTKSVKAKGKDEEKINLCDWDISSVYVKAKGVRNMKTKAKDIKSKNARDKAVTSVIVQHTGLRSEKVKRKAIKSKNSRDKKVTSIIVKRTGLRSESKNQKDIKSLKVKALGHRSVSKRRKISEDKRSEVVPEKQKEVLKKSKKKFNGHKRSKKGKSKRGKSEKSGDGISWHKNKRSAVYQSYWLNGLLWARKPLTEQQRYFRERNIILPFQHTEDPVLKPLCCLCHKEYNLGVIYICCERCQDWFHGDALYLTDENINDLTGFRCHKCRMKSQPVCPFVKNALIGDADLDTECETGVDIVGNVCQNEDNKYCRSYIVWKEVNLVRERREDACVEHQKDEDNDHDVCVEPQKDQGGDHYACVDHRKDKSDDRGKPHEYCSVRVAYDHLDEMHSENVTEAEELGLCLKTLLTNGYATGLQHITNLEKSCAKEFEDCANIIQRRDHMDEDQREDSFLPEEEPGLFSKSVSVNLGSDQLPQQVEENVASTENENEVEVGLYRISKVPDSDSHVVCTNSHPAVLDSQIILSLPILDDVVGGKS